MIHPGDELIEDRGRKRVPAALLTCVGFGKRVELGWVAASKWVSLEGWQSSTWVLYVCLEAKRKVQHFWIRKQQQARLKQLLPIIWLQQRLCSMHLRSAFTFTAYQYFSTGCCSWLSRKCRAEILSLSKHCGNIEGWRLWRSCFHPDWPLGVIASWQEEAHNAQNTSKVPTRAEVPSAHLYCVCFRPDALPLHDSCSTNPEASWMWTWSVPKGRLDLNIQKVVWMSQNLTVSRDGQNFIIVFD